MKTSLVGSLAALVLGVTALATVALGASALVAITQEDQRDVMLTVYNGGLGLVKDVREVRLAAGTGEAQFADVASLIDPTSVHLRSLTSPAGLRVLEQNYEFDLVSSAKLMEKYVGRKVRIYASDGTFNEATLLSTNGPVFEINGQIHLGYGGRLVLPSIPENLVSKPTLVWLLENQLTTPQRIEASYLTGGISWKCDYVMVLNAADDRADLTGWVTIDNKSGATYGNAALKLVAGDLNRAREPKQLERMMDAAAKAAPSNDARGFAAEGFFEYHLYSLDGRTTVKDQQTKQLTLLTARDVTVRKQLVYYGAQDYYRNAYGVPISNQKVTVLLEVKNEKPRLGLALPKGKMRVYKADRSGSEQLVGEDWIDHTPKDERVKLRLGNAFDVVGERTQKDWRKIAPNLYEVEWEISLRNHKSEPQTVTVIEPVPGDWSVLSATHRWEKIESHTLKFDVPIHKDATEKVTYRVRIRY
ncbi:MAG: DUF4139 domain-containing protein [Candidatus Rokuibacteriota bacterium]|nr:MAG: DUF4139 domain-containing protein [Candidatus Rokubacteria bacterium]